jgi:hypothetical protein
MPCSKARQAIRIESGGCRRSRLPEDLIGTVIYLSLPASDFVTGVRTSRRTLNRHAGAERTVITDFRAQRSHDRGTGLPMAAFGHNIAPERPVILWMSAEII